jgi:hypothetical protein
VSSVSDAGGQSNKRVIALVLAIIGVVGIILGIVYLAIPAGSLPGILGHIKGSSGHHALRMAASFVIGVVCLAAAWFVNKGGKGTASTGASAPAEASTRD